MSNHITDTVLKEFAGAIDLPDSGYESAKRRYEDLADWFDRPESKCSRHSPHIYPQGSFRLGTVIRPLSEDGEYDLDLGCRLRLGVTKANYTQKQLKTLTGSDLEAYRLARGIKTGLEEKNRCWRLLYADSLSFHLDAVPSIPETASGRLLIETAMTDAGTLRSQAQSVAALTGAITDRTSPNYDLISPLWRVSNSEGYAVWFESRMKLAQAFLEERALVAKVLKVDDLPSYKWKSPLQRAVQLLKRHRDVMYEDDTDSQPISIILTTLAARAYTGESTVADALHQILSTMGSQVGPSKPRIANPVNPAEDFADKWHDPAYQRLRLEANFWLWLEKATEDFQVILTNSDTRVLAVHANRTLRVGLSAASLNAKLGVGSLASLLRPATTPSSDLSFPPKPIIPTKPAGFA